MDIFLLLAIIGIISSIYKNIKKQRKPGTAAEPEKPWQRMLGEFTKEYEKTKAGHTYRPLQSAKPVTSAVRAPAPTPVPVPVPVPVPAYAIREEGSADEEGTPDLEGRSLPGSLFPIDTIPVQTQLWHEPTVPQSSLFPQGLHLQGNDLVRAVVMSEILTRPCDRKRGWNRR